MDKNRYTYFITIPILLIVHLCIISFWVLSIKTEKELKTIEKPASVYPPYAQKAPVVKLDKKLFINY